MAGEFADKFSIVDYVIFSLSLACSALVGVYYACSGGKQRTVGEYLFGDKNLSVFPVAMSIVASGTSALGILAITAEIYRFGSILMLETLAIFVFAPITAFVYLPLFYKLQLSSTYQYLELRFSKTVRRTATFLFLFQTQIFMATCLYAPSSALSQVTGLSLWATVIGSSVVCVFYTVIGGLKAVVLTDTIQQILVIIGLLAVVIKGVIVLGGIESIYAVAEQGGRTQFLDWNTDPTYMYTTWTVFIGGIFCWLPYYACDQCLVQRYLSLGTLKKAQQAILLTTIIYIPLNFINLLCGWIVYVYYSQCDPQSVDRIERADQILPLFVMESLSMTQGIPGLFVAAIYCASLSTLSSGLAAMATIILEDGIKPFSLHFWSRKYNEREEAVISKISVLIIGGVSLGLAFLIPSLGKTLFQIAMSLYGITAGPFLGVFTLGMFFSFVHTWAAGTSIVVGVSFTTWVIFGGFGRHMATVPNLPISTEGCNITNLTHITNFTIDTILSSSNILDHSNFTEPEYEGINIMYRISYWHYPLMGFIVTVTLGFLLSPICHLFKKETADPNLVYHPKQILRDLFCSKKKEETSANGYVFMPLQLTGPFVNIDEIPPLYAEEKQPLNVEEEEDEVL